MLSGQHVWEHLRCDKGDTEMDNDYFVKLGPEAFGLLYDMVEEEVSQHPDPSEIIKVENLPLLETWVAIQRADKEHRCVDEGHKLIV